MARREKEAWRGRAAIEARILADIVELEERIPVLEETTKPIAPDKGCWGSDATEPSVTTRGTGESPGAAHIDRNTDR